jgi:hypothetical protein
MGILIGKRANEYIGKAWKKYFLVSVDIRKKD